MLQTQILLPRRIPLFTAISLAAIALILTLPSPAQDLSRRLILKDGSYQLVTKYEVKGDRVRYKSAERDEWEELPSSLVDWPATEKYEKDRTAGPTIPEASALDKETDAEREAEESHLPQVAPGLRLPEDSGVFLLDNFQGQPQLVELQQSEGDINRNTKGNIFRGAINPIASAKQTIELDGTHAPMQSHVEVPSLYINLDAAPNRPDPTAMKGSTNAPPSPQQSSVPPDRFRIVRAEVKNGKRILGDVKRQVTGKISPEQHLVKTTITRVSGGWLKLTPTESLAPGEYVLVEMMTQEGGKEGMNLYVWDFGVNPKAPANANPWRPSAPDAKSAPPSNPQ